MKCVIKTKYDWEEREASWKDNKRAICPYKYAKSKNANINEPAPLYCPYRLEHILSESR